MNTEYFNNDCPEELEDEVFMIETAGEMPEVALAESLEALGVIENSWRKCLEAAVARTYIAMISRDFNPDNVGLSHYRGLGRALANIGRLETFLAKCGDSLPKGLVDSLSRQLWRYLENENQALADGRKYISAAPRHITRLCEVLRLDMSELRVLGDGMSALPALDVMGLIKLRALEDAGGQYKRRRDGAGQVLIEILDGQGRVAQTNAMSTLGPRDENDPAMMRRAELVWSMLALPEYPESNY